MTLVERDLKVNWHPYTQMLGNPNACAITKAKGAYLFDVSERPILDAISSWWVILHGHCHPEIISQIEKQIRNLDQVIFANFTHPSAVELSEKLLKILPNNQKKIFYSDNGSTAVEVAIKMAIQYWANLGKEKSKIVSLSGAYHGDTFGSMSISHRSTFTKPFHRLLFETLELPFPTKENIESVQKQLETYFSGEDVAAFIFEPLVQGVSGFRMYDSFLLEGLLKLCDDFGVLTIADEVLTGFGRTGPNFATEGLHHLPDIICLAKGITGGFIPLGVTACTSDIFEAFLSNDSSKTFFHGHSYTANPIACAASCASIDLLNTEDCKFRRTKIEARLSSKIERLSQFPILKNIRLKGTILAADLAVNPSYFDPIAKKMAAFFLDRGILIRPLGSTFYVLPPYCITDDEIELIFRVLEEFLKNGTG